MRSSVIIATYNRPEILELTIKSYFRQTDKDFEMIIADDGSDERTRLLVEKYQRISPFPINHVWHPKMGFRKAKILNMAAAVSKTQHLIFTDDDCLAPPHFVKLHKFYINRTGLVLGKIVDADESDSVNKLVSKEISLADIENKFYSNKLEYLKLIYKDIRYNLPVYFQDFFGFSYKKKIPRLWGANFSVLKRFFLKVNGFDENYKDFGGEDTDLDIRLRMLRVRPTYCYSRIIVYHIGPGRYSVRQYFTNQDYITYHFLRKRTNPFCQNGINKYL